MNATEMEGAELGRESLGRKRRARTSFSEVNNSICGVSMKRGLAGDL